MRHCPNCGQSRKYSFSKPIDEQLSATWQLSPAYIRLFNSREGSVCIHCGTNKRAQGLAQAILNSHLGFGAQNLVEWVQLANLRKLRVCELNSCHNLHETLKKLKNYTFAEFGTPTQQNIMDLTYKNSSFDLVLHSETLEHVHDPARATAECRRVLRNKGIVLFTTPIIWSRKTRQRAERKDGKTIKLLPPSYHAIQREDYLVFFEYGRDACDILGADIQYIDWRNQNYVFASNKSGDTISIKHKVQCRVLEQIVRVKEGLRI